MKKALMIICLCAVIVMIGLGIYWKTTYVNQDAIETYTEYGLSNMEFNMITRMYHMEDVPHAYEVDDQYDFTSIKLKITENTEKAVAVMNYDLFQLSNVYVDQARKTAGEYGITADTPMTADWVSTHPKEAVNIMLQLPGQGTGIFTGEDLDNCYNSWILNKQSK